MKKISPIDRSLRDLFKTPLISQICRRKCCIRRPNFLKAIFEKSVFKNFEGSELIRRTEIFGVFLKFSQSSFATDPDDETNVDGLSSSRSVDWTTFGYIPNL